MRRELSQNERRLAVLALIGLFWGAFLVAIGFALWFVVAVLTVLLTGAAGALQGRTVAEVARRALATGRAAFSAAGSRARTLIGRAHARAVQPGRRDALRLNRQAAALRQEGRIDAALELSEQALVLFRALGDRRGEALTLNGFGLAQARLGDEAGALDSYETAVAILGELGDSHAAGRVLANIGALHRGQGHEEQARAAWHDALERLEPGTPEHDRTAQQLRLAS